MEEYCVKLLVSLILKTLVEELSHWRILLSVKPARPVWDDPPELIFPLSKEETVLCTIPRSMLLSTRTSALPSLLGREDWTVLGKGWTALILYMMYEEVQGDASPWCSYLRTNFDTLIYCPKKS